MNPFRYESIEEFEYLESYQFGKRKLVTDLNYIDNVCICNELFYDNFGAFEKCNRKLGDCQQFRNILENIGFHLTKITTNANFIQKKNFFCEFFDFQNQFRNLLDFSVTGWSDSTRDIYPRLLSSLILSNNLKCLRISDLRPEISNFLKKAPFRLHELQIYCLQKHMLVNFIELFTGTFPALINLQFLLVGDNLDGWKEILNDMFVAMCFHLQNLRKLHISLTSISDTKISENLLTFVHKTLEDRKNKMEDTSHSIQNILIESDNNSILKIFMQSLSPLITRATNLNFQYKGNCFHYPRNMEGVDLVKLMNVNDFEMFHNIFKFSKISLSSICLVHNESEERKACPLLCDSSKNECIIQTIRRFWWRASKWYTKASVFSSKFGKLYRILY